MMVNHGTSWLFVISDQKSSVVNFPEQLIKNDWFLQMFPTEKGGDQSQRPEHLPIPAWHLGGTGGLILLTIGGLSTEYSSVF